MDASVFRHNESFYLTQLQGILGDIEQVYSNIRRSGQRFRNNENIIRDGFAQYLCNDNYKNTSTTYVRHYQVDIEVRESVHGRTDLRFLQVDPYDTQNTYFSIECKRLDGSNRLCKEYVVNGIRRFTSNKYSSLLGCNAMLGFVVSPISVQIIVGKVNCNLMSSAYLKINSAVTNPVVRLVSRHDTPRKFVLFHLWLDCADLV